MTKKPVKTKFLHLYETNAEFEEDYNNDNIYHTPWVSHTLPPDNRVHYNKKDAPDEYSVTVTYENRAPQGQTGTATKTGPKGTPLRFTLPAAPSAWEEHGFIGWCTKEWPTYQESQTMVKTPGSTVSLTSNTTFHAVYNVTFQGLINEGYVELNKMPSRSSEGNYMLVKPNNYPKELVTDFQQVFDCNEGKLVSLNGVVGEGTTKNIFCFLDSSEHWLTSNEWYDIYNNVPLNHSIATKQFFGIDWSDKESITIRYSGGNWQYGESTIGPFCPRVVNIRFDSGQYGNLQKMYGHTNVFSGCGAEIINASNAAGTAVGISNGNAGANAAFEGCVNLKEIHNINFSNVTNWLFAFDGCRSLETIPIGDFPATITMAGSIYQVFCNNYSLKTIEPVLNISGVGLTNASFYGCSNLETLHLHGINAASNVCDGSGSFYQDAKYAWDLHFTKLIQACADEIISNVTPCDPTVEGFVYKGINFPDGITLTSAQKTTLRSNGWIPYINGVEQN